MNPEEGALTRQALRAAEGSASRLSRSQRKLAPHFPLSPATVSALAPEVEDDLDAFLKRYEQLVNAIQDELVKAVAIVGDEDIRGLARREVAELMDRLGARARRDPEPNRPHVSGRSAAAGREPERGLQRRARPSRRLRERPSLPRGSLAATPIRLIHDRRNPTFTS